MTSSTTPATKGFHVTATPILRAKDAASAIAFYAQAFGATETMRLTDPDGGIMNAAFTIGGAPFMISDEFPEMGALSPQSLGGSSVTMNLAVADADALIAQAVAAGAKLVSPATDQFYGYRDGRIEDPFGYTWLIGTRVEEVSPEEMQARATALFGGA